MLQALSRWLRALSVRMTKDSSSSSVATKAEPRRVDPMRDPVALRIYGVRGALLAHYYASDLRYGHRAVMCRDARDLWS